MKRLLERHGGHSVPRLAAGLVHSPKLKLVVRAAASLLTQWPAVGKWGLKLLSGGEQGAPDCFVVGGVAGGGEGGFGAVDGGEAGSPAYLSPAGPSARTPAV